MKNPPFIPSRCLSLFLLALFPILATANPASLKTSDGIGTSSFTGATNWSITGVPNATNDYFTSTFFMRTPGDANSYTFGGASLTLQPPSTAATRSIIYKGTGGNVYTINNFTNSGGVINSGAGNVAAPTFAGNIMYIAANSTLSADQGAFIISAPLAGPANWTNNGGFSVTYNGTNSAFTGRLVLGGTVTAILNSPGAAPGNPAGFMPDQFILGAGTTLRDNFGVTLNNANAGITLAGAATINAANAGTNTVLAEPIAGAYTLTKSGGGTLTLAGSNVMTGLVLSGATAGSRLNINSTNALGIGAFTIQSGDNATIDNTTGAALTLLANNAQNWNNNFAFAGSSSLNLGTGAVALSGNRTLTVSANNLTVGGIIAGAGFSLTKTGAGTLTLGGANTYTGNTTINGGALVLTGGGSVAGSPTVSLASGTTLDVAAVSFGLGASQTLAGGGTVNGNVADSSGSQILPGGSGGVGSLTFNNNLSLAGGDTLRFDFAAGTNDLLVGGGNLAVGGVTTINLASLPASLPSGTYTLIQVAGTLGGSAASFAITGTPTPSRQAFNILYDTVSSPRRVLLQVVNDSASLVWLGTPAPIWDVVTTANWTNLTTVSADLFYNGDSVSFTDLGAANPPVLNTIVQPGLITFNSANDYVLSGTGSVSGSGGLTKAGNGTLTITTTNNYTGITALNGGTVSVGNVTDGGVASPLGAASSASGNLTFDGGKLQYTGDTASTTHGATLNAGGATVEVVNPATTLTLGGAIAGTSGGTFTKLGDGALLLNGANTFNGPTVVSAGILTASNGIPDASAVLLADVSGVALNLVTNEVLGSLAGGGYNGGNVTLAGGMLTLGGNNASTTFGGTISGAGGVTKVGTGTFTLENNNSFSGSLFAKSGTVVVDASGSISTTVYCSIGQDGTDNATLTLKGSGYFTTTADFNVGDIGSAVGTLNVQDNASLSASALFVASANAAGSTASGTVNQTGGTVSQTSTTLGAFTIGGRTATNGVGIYNLSGGTLTAAAAVRMSGYGSSIFNQSGGTFTASGGLNLQRFSGPGGTYNLNGGTLQAFNVQASVAATDSNFHSVFNFNGGLLLPTAASTTFMQALSRANVRNGGAVIDTSGYGVTINQPLMHSDIVGDNATDGGLIKQGSGALTLVATNTYTGPTVVNGDTLIVNGVMGTGAVTVNSGSTLAGSGILNGTTTVQGATLSPGAAIGVMTINNNLALENGSTAIFNFSAGTNSTLTVSGAVNVNGATAVNLVLNSAIPKVGATTLIRYGTTLSGFANLTMATTNPRYTFSLTNDTAAKEVQLVVAGIPAALTWVGDGSVNAWENTGSYQVWKNGASASYFYDGDSVTFDSTGSTSPAVNLMNTVIPGSVTVNSTTDYDFAGSGAITSSGDLIKNGAGRLTLEVSNTYVNAAINAGTVQVGNGATGGTLAATALTNNGALVFNRLDVLAFATPISGSGSVSQIGGGSVAVTASNSYAGLTVISAGVLLPDNAAALGTADAGTIATNGGQLYLDQNLDFPNEALTLGGAGLRKGGGGASTLGGPIALVADTIVHIDGGATLNLTNAGGISGAGYNLELNGDGGSVGTVVGPVGLGIGGLTKNGAGAWTLGVSNHFTGLTVINAGTLRITGGSLGNPATFTPNQITLAGGGLEAVTNATFNDGLAGITLGANSTFTVDAGAILTVSNEITGAYNLTKSAAGTLVLATSNSFSGILNVDTTSTSANDGATRIASPNALAGVPVTPGTATILQGNNNGGYSTLQLDGTAGNLTVAQDLSMTCRNTANPNLQNLAGSNTISGGIQVQVGGGNLYFQSDSGTLNLAGTVQYVGTSTAGRVYNFVGGGNHLVSGIIADGANGAPISLTKSGTGTLTLPTANTYSGATTVSGGVLLLTSSLTTTGGVAVAGGTLSGTGVINDRVAVQTGGTLSPGLGLGSLGTLTINSNLTLAGTLAVDVNKNFGTSDRVVGLTSVTYGGTLFATNLAGTLNLGDSFTLFSTAAHAGNFTNILGSPGPGKAWSFNPTSGILSVVTGMASNPTNLTAVVSGGTLTLSWPADHLGWILQSQTNSATTGLGSNWVDVAGSAASNTNLILINPANPTVFFRLRLP